VFPSDLFPPVRLRAAWIVTLAATACAQPAGTGVVSGTVVEASSGDAVRKAVVTLTWQGTPRSWATARTDGSGRFRFEGLPAGKYDLRATKTGVGTAIYGGNSFRELGEFVALGDGETRDGLTLRFIHSGSIAGRVLDVDGDPINGVTVELMRPGRNLGERVLVNFRAATTNDRGEYRISNVDPGQYYLAANPMRGGWVPMQLAHVALMRQFYGGARESKNSSPVTVRAGEGLTGLDFHLTAEPLVPIRGQITGVPDLPATTQPQMERLGLVEAPAEVISVMVSSIEEGRPQIAMGAGAQGPEYRFDAGEMPPGRYRVQAEAEGKDRIYAASKVVDVQPGMGDVILALTPAIELKGRLRIEGPGGPAVGSFNISLIPGGMRNTGTRAGADGSFTLGPISEGEWALVVNPLPRGAFLKSADFGDKDVRFTRFEVGSKTDAALNIVVSMNSAKVEGEIDAAGADSARAGILLAPFGEFHNLARFYYSVPADAAGKFRLNGIAPGKYKIFALEKMAAANFRTPEAADQLDALGTEIELKEGATTEARPKLIPMERAREALP